MHLFCIISLVCVITTFTDDLMRARIMFEVFFASRAMANTELYAEFFDDLLTVVTAMENEKTEDRLISEDHLQHSISVLK